MSKHSRAFKQSVVEFYLRGNDGYGKVGAEFGIDHSTVLKWVAIYEAHGVAGLSKKFSSYDAEFKLSVLKRMWEDGLSCRQTAALFNIRNAGCLSDWERRYEIGGIDALARAAEEGPERCPSRRCPSSRKRRRTMRRRAAQNCWRN